MINTAAVKKCLKAFEFETLFREHLGWDRLRSTLHLTVGRDSFNLSGIAEKCGFVAYVCASIPDRAIRLKIDHQVTKSAREHFIIYADEEAGQQVWQWVRREPGKPMASRDHRFDVRQSGDPLIQRLEQIAVALEEEEDLSVVDMAGRSRRAFDVDKITKKFYDRFKAEHTVFLKFIKGFPPPTIEKKVEIPHPDHQWYTSLMLNRLMFVYFIQKKGFLDGDVDYLRNRLKSVQAARGKDKFQTFYRYFLLRLFHDGLGKPDGERNLDSALLKLIGRAPFLNGGFFEVHQLEEKYSEIDIPDKAFEKLFAFFDQYRWHLDERPLRADNEINPDVVGYIFEKYINQKQMGAYYTKEDITDYISKNTIIPFLFDAAEKKCAIAFRPDGALWGLLRDDPDRYIYAAVKHGVVRDDGSIIPESDLPDFVQIGMHDPAARMHDNRYNLQQAPADDPIRLVTETWREYVARRTRCLAIRETLSRGTGGGTGSGTESSTESGTGVSPVNPILSQPVTGETPVPQNSSFHVSNRLFIPFDPNENLSTTRRNLPHWHQSGRTYFVTFRLADSLPADKLAQWRAERDTWLKEHPEPWSKKTCDEHDRLFPQRLEAWLDAGEGECLLRRPELAGVVEGALRKFDGDRYVLDAYVVMPNHVHALLKPLGEHTLSKILHSWKSYTAHEINRQSNRKGSVWQDEPFDHVVRTAERLDHFREYINNNPEYGNIKPGAARVGAGFGLIMTDDTDDTGETPVPQKNEEDKTSGTGVPPVREDISFTHSINDLITLNLDIWQFARDAIVNAEGPELLRAFWTAIERITVLDPTCGSGAFLFAALRILETLYSDCLERMRQFLAEQEAAQSRGTGVSPANLRKQTNAKPGHTQLHTGETPVPHTTTTKKYRDFRQILDRVAQHPNERYFIFKSIIINNLFGVDIMEEAVEICKLRLFLKLAAQVEPDPDKANLGIEQLPDIDFNIRAGNTLVGYASEQQARDALEGDIASMAEWPVIEESAKRASTYYDEFRHAQSDPNANAEDQHSWKKALADELEELRSRLDRALAKEFGHDDPVKNAKEFAAWKASHEPFHWFVEFYGIMHGGGFDVIIGNPPYFELNALKGYTLRGYDCSSAGNIYALIIERAFALDCHTGRMGFIVPVSSVSTARYVPLQNLLSTRLLHYSSFDDRPSRLFDGLEHIRLTIHLISGRHEEPTMHSTRYNKWSSEERNHLFQMLAYSEAEPILVSGTMPKTSSPIEDVIIRSLISENARASQFFQKTGMHSIYYSRKVGYFLQVLDFTPAVYDGQGNPRPPSEFKELAFNDPGLARNALACFNANLFYWFITVFSDCRHVNRREIDSLPVDLKRLEDGPCGKRLVVLAAALMRSLNSDSECRSMRFSHDTLTVQCIVPKSSKPIIDDIDRVLANHYGFTDEELDFIINYDIKYRMGADSGDENE